MRHSLRPLSMHRRRVIAACAGIASLGFACRTGGAQSVSDWPDRRVRLITPAAPGSSLDLVARLVGERLATRWGQPVAIENRPGADGIPALEALRVAPTGEALMMANHGVLTVTPILHPRLAFDPLVEFVPIVDLTADLFGVVVSSDLPAHTLAEFVALARARPGMLNWTAPPGPPTLAMRAFLRDEGDLRAEFVAFRGVGTAAVAELVAGRIQAMLSPIATVVAATREGQVRVLAITGGVRAPALPTVPTSAEAGYPTFQQEGVHGLIGWKGMPRALAARIADEAASVVTEPELAGRLRTMGLAVRAGGTPERFTALMAEQRSRWADLARAFGTAPPG